MTYISSLSLSSPARQSVLQAQASLAQAQSEVSSGAPADLGLTLGAQTGTLLSLRSQIDGLNGYSSGNAVAATRLSATADGLSSLLTTAQTLSSSLIAASSAGGDIDALSAGAQGALASLGSGLDATVAGASVFGGLNTGASPLGSGFPAAAQAAVSKAFTSFVAANGGDASAITATQFQSFLAQDVAPIFSGSGWSGLSSATDATAQTAVAPGTTVGTGVSANEAAFRQSAEAYTVLSVFTGSGSPLNASAKAAAGGAATTLLSSGIAGLTELQARVGVAQQGVDAAASRIGATTATLTSEAGTIGGVDVYALSTKVTALQNQLEASYELTSRLQSLSLTNYLTS